MVVSGPVVVELASAQFTVVEEAPWLWRRWELGRKYPQYRVLP